jgi:hypothetical protein
MDGETNTEIKQFQVPHVIVFETEVVISEWVKVAFNDNIKEQSK